MGIFPKLLSITSRFVLYKSQPCKQHMKGEREIWMLN